MRASGVFNHGFWLLLPRRLCAIKRQQLVRNSFCGACFAPPHRF
jgi:hypothetical protein